MQVTNAMPSRPALVAALLLVGAAGVVAVRDGSGPSLASNDVAHRNGPILVTWNHALTWIDPVTGTLIFVGDQPIRTPASATDIAWSPDGHALAFAADDGVRIASATGISPVISRCGPKAGRCDIDWSPDGTWIAVAYAGHIDLVRPDGSATRRLIDVPGSRAGLDPAWSPDGRRLAVAHHGHESDVAPGLQVIDLGDGGLTPVATAPVGSIGFVDPVWSLDGRSISYLGSDDGWAAPESGSDRDRWTLRVLRVDPAGGAAPEVVAVVGGCRPAMMRPHDVTCAGVMPGLTLAPDGTTLAVVTASRRADGDAAVAGLYLMDAEGGDLRLAREGAVGTPAWRPLS
jgi:Tol biopolymer transport system component